MSLPLENTWCIYHHEKSSNLEYEKGTNFICKFDNVHSFFNCFNYVPLPSKLFYQDYIGKPYYIDLNKKKEIASISMFKEGIEPKWEDLKNINGGEIALRKFIKRGNSPIQYLDHLWSELSMACIGSVFENSNTITGIRVVDSSIPNLNKPLYRIELWIDDIQYMDAIEKEFRKILELNPTDQIIKKNHNNSN